MDEIICKRLCLVLKSGAFCFPKRVKNTVTGERTFRLTPGGRYGNRLENTTEVSDVDEMIRLVLSGERLVRAQNSATGAHNNYGVGRRSVKFVELDGKVVWTAAV